jgi:hypothetical protein
MSLLGRVQQLSEQIGPRGSATAAEGNAANAVSKYLTDYGLSPEHLPFLSVTSAYSPLAVATGAVLVGLFLFWQPQAVGAAAAAILAIGALIAAALELNSRDNPLRWVVPTGRSENIIARVPARSIDSAAGSANMVPPPLLVTAHLDAPRAPLLFSTPGWRRFARALVPLTMGAIAILAVLFVIGIVTDARTLREIALIPGAVVVLAFALLLQAANSPFSPGANDNASGVSVALDLAERLSRQPMTRRKVVLAFTGCGEVGAYGFNALRVTHDSELRGSTHLVVDAVGGQAGRDIGPSIVSGDPRMRRLAEGVIARHPELDVRVADASFTPAELAVSARHGVIALGLSALDSGGAPPNWRRTSDIAADVSEATLGRAAEFAWQLIQALDAEDCA